MNLLKTKILPISIAAFAVFAMSGCGSSAGNSNGDDGDDGGDGGDLVPPIEKKDMTNVQAKDAMAIHAAIYPIIAPVAEITNCLTSTDAMMQCIEDATGVDTRALPEIIKPGNTYACTVGENPTATPPHGTFKYDKDASTGTVKFTFSDNCSDKGNNKKLHDNLIIKACLLNLNTLVTVDKGTHPTDGTFRAEYKGSVECRPGKNMGNYSYRTVGNSSGKKKMEWSYNGSLEFSDGKVSANGSIRSITRYGDANTDWESLFLGSDQEWTFTDNTSIALGNNMVLNGKATYIKHPNDNTGEQGEGYEFYMTFESLAYNFIKNGRDITSTVSGKASASCHEELITYGTATDMEDVDSLRDSTHHRMPSSGDMSVSLEGYNDAPVKFSSEGNTAKVSIGDVDYASWNSIIDGSSCAQMNDFLGNLPQPPVKYPTAGEIIVDNLVFDNVSKRVLATDKMSITGETDGQAVWYYLAREQGYTDGQTVEQTMLDFSATGPQRIFVDVHLYDENGGEQYVKIENNAGWTALQNDPVKKLWTIRTDYMEGKILQGVLYQGNFILRIGNSDYEGSDPFTITKFVVKKI